MGVNDLSNDEFERLYGPWAPRTPADVAALFEGYPGTWWVAGGWAIEAFTGVRREHEDTDTCVLRSDLAVLRKHLAGRFDVWAAGTTALRPLLPDDDPDDAAGSGAPSSRPCPTTRGSQPSSHPATIAESARSNAPTRRSIWSGCADSAIDRQETVVSSWVARVRTT